jgi:hypothetical protein
MLTVRCRICRNIRWYGGEMHKLIRCLKKVFRAALCVAAVVLSVGDAAGREIKADPLLPLILFIGDSHAAGSFGMQEDALLRGMKQFSVATYAICGSSPQSWFQGMTTECGYFFKDTAGRELRGQQGQTPRMADLLNVHQPRYTVIELGANMYGGPVEWVEKTSLEMAMAVVSSGSKCIWIGPPRARVQPEPELGRIFDALQRSVGQYCLLFDSRKFTNYPATGGDGIHFDSLGEPGRHIAQNWALSAFYAFRPVLKAGPLK